LIISIISTSIGIIIAMKVLDR